MAGELTEQVYDINCVLAQKIVYDQVIRQEKACHVVLGTEKGVRAFLVENSPLVSYTITHIPTKTNVTDKFSYKTVSSIYNQPVTILRYYRKVK